MSLIDRLLHRRRDDEGGHGSAPEREDQDHRRVHAGHEHESHSGHSRRGAYGPAGDEHHGGGHAGSTAASARTAPPERLRHR